MAVKRKKRVVNRKNRRRRNNPARRTNPGISGIVMGGLWVGLGMWAGGIVGGFIPRFGSGFIGETLHAVITAYGVNWLGSRFTRNAGLMAAGAFAPTAMNLLGGVIGGASSLVGGIGGGGGGSSTPRQITAAPPPGSNVVAMPAAHAN